MTALDSARPSLPGSASVRCPPSQGVKRQFIPGYPTKPPQVKPSKAKAKRQPIPLGGSARSKNPFGGSGLKLGG